ncbi:YbaB/EbfC family nucleoid-associated protein [Rhodococcus sp. TAF43]|uniref:YbaB/EbfC family nucleoid-associated protein n=1 Tax=unclassified Rhodococcus (in: high G+C Gram-positive bacteria) TaxID=192944 RepID=UPI001581DC86|nr:YbaB/EbfC family nucleoid-associated protein [Rhodococcus sp. W8901]QKT09816.1 YbaB/EbfC family nucleoid-associated protein [Rhodococcus sp. W8901]
MTSAPLDDLAVKARRVHEAVTLVRGRAQSAGGHVTAEVDAAGRITALTITDTALAGGATTLAAIVTATHRAACTEAEEAAQALRGELAADPRVAQVIAGTRTTAPTTPRYHPGPDADEDAYYATRSILRSI